MFDYRCLHSPIYTSVSLREKCPNTDLFLVGMIPYSGWIRRDASYLRIQSECGKIRTRNNSVIGHFSRSVCYSSSNILKLEVLLVKDVLILILCYFKSYLSPGGLEKLFFLITPFTFPICTVIANSNSEIG